MSWFIPSIIAQMALTFVLALINIYLLWFEKKRYFLYWTASWALWTLKLILDLLIYTGETLAVLQIINLLSWLFAVLMFILGIHSFLNKKRPRYFLYISAAITIWVIISYLLNFPLYLQLIPLFIFIGTINVITGVVILRSKNIDVTGKHLTGWTMILLGLHITDFPFLANVEWFAPWGYLIAFILTLITAIGALLLYYQKLRRELIESEARYRQAADELRLMEKSRTHFLTNISHDLRTPITSIQGYIEALLSDVFAEHEQKKYLNLIHDRALGLNRMINDLFELVKLESRKVTLNLTKIPVTKLIQHLHEKYELDIKRNGLNIIIEDSNIKVNNPIPVINIDLNRIDQVLDNLISNAVKHTSVKGTITIFFELINDSKDILIKVMDNGSGIEEKDLPYVFDRFYKGDQLRNSSEKSSGLGLAITKEIVEIHKGRIWVESSPQQGSTFYFTLPLNTDTTNYSG